MPDSVANSVAGSAVVAVDLLLSLAIIISVPFGSVQKFDGT